MELHNPLMHNDTLQVEQSWVIIQAAALVYWFRDDKLSSANKLDTNNIYMALHVLSFSEPSSEAKQ
jgi:hypothetical protein